jgi:hypothetical protein
MIINNNNIYNDNNKIMSKNKKAEIILLYGFSIERDEDNEDDEDEPVVDEEEDILQKLDDDVKIYDIPFYGDTKQKRLRYVGIEFGRVMSVFNNLHYSVDTLQMTRQKPSKEIKKKMKKLFPNKKLQEQAIIQNIYTSHYVNGNVYCGYFVSVDEKEIANPDDSAEITDYVSENKNNLELLCMSHNITDNNTFIGGYDFIGKCLSDFKEFEFTDEENPGNVFYNILRTKYKADYYDVTVEFKENVEHLEKMMVFMPEMCYCCT